MLIGVETGALVSYRDDHVLPRLAGRERAGSTSSRFGSFSTKPPADGFDEEEATAAGRGGGGGAIGNVLTFTTGPPIASLHSHCRLAAVWTPQCGLADLYGGLCCAVLCCPLASKEKDRLYFARSLN